MYDGKSIKSTLTGTVDYYQWQATEEYLLNDSAAVGKRFALPAKCKFVLEFTDWSIQTNSYSIIKVECVSPLPLE